MPLVYSEGPRAFTRLQEELIGGNGDLSILAWSDIGSVQSRFNVDPFATEPGDFVRCGSVVCTEQTNGA